MSAIIPFQFEAHAVRVQVDELGQPWFRLFGFPFYMPPAFFWWWYGYDAYAPQIFVEGAYIAASGGFIAVAVAIGIGGIDAEMHGARKEWCCGRSVFTITKLALITRSCG